MTKKLGASFLENLACIGLSGDFVDMMYVFDFSLWNPSPAMTGGYFAFWEGNKPEFYPFRGERASIAHHALDSIRRDVQRNGRSVFNGIEANLVSKAWLN